MLENKGMFGLASGDRGALSLDWDIADEKWQAYDIEVIDTLGNRHPETADIIIKPWFRKNDVENAITKEAERLANEYGYTYLVWEYLQ